jgi:DNA-binding response OmpR family regulator
MKLLVAEDDVLFQRVLAQILPEEFEVTLACNGNEAWEILQQPDAPQLAILDWVMPGLNGPEICRKVRAREELKSMYLIIVTSKNSEADIVSGLRAGADDYITKPPVPAELRARVRVGERVLRLQQAVAAQSMSGRRWLTEESLGREQQRQKRRKTIETNREAERSPSRFISPAPHAEIELYPVACGEETILRDGLHSLEDVHLKR